MMLKIAVFAPIPRASAMVAMADDAGLRRSNRNPNRASRHSLCMDRHPEVGKKSTDKHALRLRIHEKVLNMPCWITRRAIGHASRYEARIPKVPCPEGEQEYG